MSQKTTPYTTLLLCAFRNAFCYLMFSKMVCLYLRAGMDIKLLHMQNTTSVATFIFASALCLATHMNFLSRNSIQCTVLVCRLSLQFGHTIMLTKGSFAGCRQLMTIVAYSQAIVYRFSQGSHMHRVKWSVFRLIKLRTPVNILLCPPKNAKINILTPNLLVTLQAVRNGQANEQQGP